MTGTPIPAHLITGATGAGKTRAVLRLLERRPAEERWAVLVNDFGALDVRDGRDAASDHVSVRLVSGCICCSAQVGLRTALVALVRSARPQRLLIESSAAARPAAILNLLKERGIAAAVGIGTSLCVASAQQLLDTRYTSLDPYREQIASADVLLLRSHRATAGEYERALTLLNAIRNPASTLVETEDALAPVVLRQQGKSL
jgi:G3E family GTPase